MEVNYRLGNYDRLAQFEQVRSELCTVFKSPHFVLTEVHHFQIMTHSHLRILNSLLYSLSQVLNRRAANDQN
jgi:hypothetical protein